MARVGKIEAGIVDNVGPTGLSVLAISGASFVTLTSLNAMWAFERRTLVAEERERAARESVAGTRRNLLYIPVAAVAGTAIGGVIASRTLVQSVSPEVEKLATSVNATTEEGLSTTFANVQTGALPNIVPTALGLGFVAFASGIAAERKRASWSNAERKVLDAGEQSASMLDDWLPSLEEAIAVQLEDRISAMLTRERARRSQLDSKLQEVSAELAGERRERETTIRRMSSRLEKQERTSELFQRALIIERSNSQVLREQLQQKTYPLSVAQQAEASRVQSALEAPDFKGRFVGLRAGWIGATNWLLSPRDRRDESANRDQ